MLRRDLRLLAGLFGAIGCGEPARTTFTVRDSAGGRVVMSTAPVDGGEPRLAVDTVPVMSLGGDDLANPSQAAWLSDGRLVVLTLDGNQLHFFDQMGRPIRTVGRRGKGPGEFERPTLIGVTTGDSVAVFDNSNRRLTLIDSAGKLAAASVWLDQGAANSYSHPIAVVPSVGFLVLSRSSITPQSRSGVIRDSASIGLADGTGKVEDRLGRFPVNDALVEADGQSVSVGAALFGRSSAFVAAGGIVWVGTADDFSIRGYAVTGRWTRRFSRSYVSSPVTEADVAAFIAQDLESIPASKSDFRDHFRRMYERAPRPAHKPPYDQVIAATDGELWIREYAEPYGRGRPSRYTIFAADGRWLATRLLPADLTPLVINARFVLSLWTDQDDVRHVRVYRRL